MTEMLCGGVAEHRHPILAFLVLELLSLYLERAPLGYGVSLVFVVPSIRGRKDSADSLKGSPVGVIESFTNDGNWRECGLGLSRLSVLREDIIIIICVNVEI